MKSTTLAKVQVSPLDEIVHAAGRKLLALRMARVAGNYADKHDADALRADLEALWSIVDPVILAVGEYAAEHFTGVLKRDIELHFTDQLRGALEDNATFILDEAGAQAQAELTGAV